MEEANPNPDSIKPKTKKDVYTLIKEMLLRNSSHSAHWYDLIKSKTKTHNRLVETTRLLLNASASSLEEKYALPTKDDGYKYSLNVAVKTGRHDTFTELDKLQRYTVDRYSSRILSTFRFVVTARPEFKESIDEGIDVEVVGGGPGFEVRGIQEYENMRDRVTGRCHPRGRRTVRDIYADEWGPILPDVIEGFEEVRSCEGRS